MAAPLSGIGQQQQVPLSQPFQPGGSDQTREIRQKDQDPRPTEIQARGAATSQSQTSRQPERRDNANNIANNNADSSQKRGSVVDIVI